MANGTFLQQSLSTQLSALDRAKRNYEKAYRDSEKASENFRKADLDYDLSRADIERYKHTMTTKIQQSDDAKNEYANQLQKTNQLQQQHYTELLPQVCFQKQFFDLFPLFAYCLYLSLLLYFKRCLIICKSWMKNVHEVCVSL